MKRLNSIKITFTAGVFVLLAAITVVLSLLSYASEKRVIQERVYAQLNAIADLKKELVVRHLTERMNDLRILATAAQLRKKVYVLLERGRDAAQRREAAAFIQERLVSVKNLSTEYLDLSVLDLDGQELVSAAYGSAGGAFRNREYHQLVPHSRETLARGSVVVEEDDTGEAHLDFVIGIPDESGRLGAVIMSSVSLADSLFPLFSDYTGLGLTGETILVKRNGGRVVFINPRRHSANPREQEAGDNGEYIKLARAAVAGNEGIDTALDYRGEQVIGAYRYIPMLGWGIVSKIDTSEAFAEIAALQVRTLVLGVGILGVMLALTYTAVQKFTAAPITELIEKTKAVAEGKYFALVKSGRKDEIGDLEENFNRMVAALEQSRREVENKQFELERKVLERTHNLTRALEAIRREAEEKKTLQLQLLQAQKMEAVGTLAGGIAHDFNNLLTAILGYGNIMLMKLAENDPLREYTHNILTAAERGAGLTHSLLAFSRKQIINPQPVSVNDVIQRIGKLLMRLIGEDVELRVALMPEHALVMADSGQIEQVLMNLCTNARDAMPDGGLLSITTEISAIDEQYIRAHGYGKLGRYVLISVADTGVGMNEETREHIFEPFFTTKEVGKGTGLGLSIVYGVVKQQNGYINCYSEPGRGTTFKIYLPLLEEAAAATGAAAAGLGMAKGGSETILVAEDNAEVRKMTTSILHEFGYTVVEAEDGEDAVRKFRERRDGIALLLLDVIMPRKNGKQAYEEIRAIRPDIKVIFTSGYTADVIHQKNILEEGLHFISKPLLPRELLQLVRDVLDAPIR